MKKILAFIILTLLLFAHSNRAHYLIDFAHQTSIITQATCLWPLLAAGLWYTSVLTTQQSVDELRNHGTFRISPNMLNETQKSLTTIAENYDYNSDKFNAQMTFNRRMIIIPLTVISFIFLAVDLIKYSR